MDIIIPITVVLMTGLFALFAGNGRAKTFMPAGLAGLIFSAVYLYFLMPALTPVGIIQSLAVASASGGVLGWRFTRASFISGMGVAAGILVFAVTVM